MAERGALKSLDPNVKKASKSGLGAPPSKIPRAGHNGKPGVDSTKQDLETKLHEVLDEYEELRSRFGELEEDNRKLTVANINMEEEASEWKKSYESLQAEGTELFQTYERKCTMLKEVSKQLDDYKNKLAERDARLKEAQSSKDAAEQERDELREKNKSINEATGKQESRYLALKDEHNQTLAKLDSLQQQLRDALRAAPRPDGMTHSESALQTSTTELEDLKKQLRETEEREKKAQQELSSMQQKVQRLLAQQKASQGPCTSPPPSSDVVGALSAITPLRAATQTPGRAGPPKTPSGAMLEMTNMSPESLRERAESLVISNDLLRQEVNASKREREDYEESVRNLEASVRDLKLQVAEAKKGTRVATEAQIAAEEQRDAAQAQVRDLSLQVEELETRGHAAGAAVVEELAAVKEQLGAAEARRTKAVGELAAAKKQVDALKDAAKNAENDMRLMYKRHKKELTELQDKYKSGELEERYRVATHKAMQMEALVHKWVGYAREMNEVRALQEKRAASIEENTAALQALVQDARQMKEDADGKVNKWKRQCRRMEKDMTKLVHIKTRALEERKELHEKYLELYQELEAQDDYARKLEENEEVLKAKLTAQAAEEINSARQEMEEMVRLEMEERVIEAESKHEQALGEAASLRAKIVDLEAEAAAARQGAAASVDATKSKMDETTSRMEELQTRLQQQEEEIEALNSKVARLEQAAEQHDAIFEGTMLEIQAKEEKCAELEDKVSKLGSELEAATNKVLASEALGESERAATQEALDELTRELSTAHEQLATAEAQAEEAERRAQASQQAAACGVARLTHVTVGMAADEDNNTDMIDPELRLHWCDDDYERKLADTKTPHELRALLVGIASTVEHLLNSGAARRDQMAEQVAALTAEVQQLGGGAAEVAAAREEAAAVRKELANATSALLEAVERGEALQAQLAESDAASSALRQRLEGVEEEAQRMNALLEDTSRENVELSGYKEEVTKLRPEKEALQSSLDACMSKLSQATAAEETLRRKAEKKLETLKHNLQVSQNDCQSLDAILAHVRASLQMYVETPSAMPADTLRKLLHRISPDDKMDDDAEE